MMVTITEKLLIRNEMSPNISPDNYRTEFDNSHQK